MALGQDFCDWYTIHDDSTLQRFTCYRNTFDRLRSLYYNFVFPAEQGFNDFGLGITLINRFGDFDVTFNTWLLHVANTRDETCNEHLHSQDWHLIVPNLTVYDFEDRQIIFDQVLHKQVEQLGQASPDLSFLKLGPSALKAIYNRYAPELETFSYLP